MMNPQVRREAREQAGKPDLDAALEKQVGLRIWIIVCVCYIYGMERSLRGRQQELTP